MQVGIRGNVKSGEIFGLLPGENYLSFAFQNLDKKSLNLSLLGPYSCCIQVILSRNFVPAKSHQSRDLAPEPNLFAIYHPPKCNSHHFSQWSSLSSQCLSPVMPVWLVVLLRRSQRQRAVACFTVEPGTNSMTFKPSVFFPPQMSTGIRSAYHTSRTRYWTRSVFQVVERA